MSTPRLVEDFYERIWMRGDLSACESLLSEDFSFRGSLGDEMRGRGRFIQYVRTMRSALSDYRCDILACVSEGAQSFAKMRFAGRHVGPFRGRAGTGKHVAWMGAALFRFEANRIAELWVLGDVAALDAMLIENERHA